MAKKAKDYNKRSAKHAQECDNDTALKAAREEIYKELTQSISIIKQLRYSEDQSIQLKAVKEHLTLAGLYVEKVEHSGSVEFQPLIISRGAAE